MQPAEERTEVLAIGPHRVHLLSLSAVPDGDDYQAGAAHDQTGLVRWPVSSSLAGWLARHDGLASGVDVLDLGCGTGVAGISAAVCCRPRRVVLSDMQPLCLALARRNARLRQEEPARCPIEVEAVGWCVGDPRPAAQSFGLVLASDCVHRALEEVRGFEKWGERFHDGRALARFVELVDWCLAPGGTALVGFGVRNAVDVERVAAALAEGGYRHEALGPDQCLSTAELALPANAECHSAVVLRCWREGEHAALLDRAPPPPPPPEDESWGGWLWRVAGWS